MKDNSRENDNYATDSATFEASIAYLGFTSITRLSDDGCVVYLAEKDGVLRIFKFVSQNNRWDWDFDSSVRHIEHESEVLNLVSGISGISKKIKFHQMFVIGDNLISETKFDDDQKKLIALEKEYIDGEILSKGRPGKWQIAQLRSIVDSLHEHGIARLDLKPRNVVYDWNGSPFIIDLGTGLIANDEKPEKFDESVKQDNLDFEKYFASQSGRSNVTWAYSPMANKTECARLDMVALGLTSQTDFLLRRKCVESLRKNLV